VFYYIVGAFEKSGQKKVYFFIKNGMAVRNEELEDARLILLSTQISVVLI